MEKLTVGWEEWLALPELGIPAIRAKVDTGAQTSSLHAFSVHRLEDGGRERIQFGIHPIPDRPDIEIYSEADLIGQREIVSSNGEVELRFIIATVAEIGGRKWPVELSLTNRETMQYRMLLGRRALEDRAIIDPLRSCVQGELDISAYESLRKVAAAPKPLTLGILTTEPDGLSEERLIEAAGARGHKTVLLESRRCYLTITDRGPEVHYDGKSLPRIDAVIPRLSDPEAVYGMAVLRHFESAGVHCLNSCTGLAIAHDRLHTHQRLARRGLPLPMTGIANAPRNTAHLIRELGGPPLLFKLIAESEAGGSVLAETRKAATSVIHAIRGLRADLLIQEYFTEADGLHLDLLVVGRRTVAALKSRTPDENDDGVRRWRKVRLTKDERKLAGRTMTATQLQVARVRLIRSDNGPRIISVDAVPQLDLFESHSGKDVAAQIVDHLERRIGRSMRAAETAKGRRKVTG